MAPWQERYDAYGPPIAHGRRVSEDRKARPLLTLLTPRYNRRGCAGLVGALARMVADHLGEQRALVGGTIVEFHEAIDLR